MRSDAGSSRHYGWTTNEVVDVGGPELIMRTYAEQADIRRYLAKTLPGGRTTAACDVGAGYGRMCPVLKEFADHVVAFEREPELLMKGAFLQPTVEFRQIQSLEQLPASDNEFDWALTFTVLQHLSHESAKATLAEIRRIVRPGGHVLICEESDETSSQGDPPDPQSHFTIGRATGQYQEWMAPFRLVATSPRVIERGYPRANVGDYLLFRG